MIRKPLNAPRTPPRTMAATMAGQIGQPCLKSSAMNSPVRPSIEATERSISPVMMMRVSGSAMIAISPTFEPDEEQVRPLQEVRRDAGSVRDRGEQQHHEQRLPAQEAAERRRPQGDPACTSLSGSRDPSQPRALLRVRIAGATRSAISRSNAIAASSKAPGEGRAPERGDVHDDERGVDGVQEQRPERGSEDRPAASEDRHTSDDDCGDDLELVADAGDRVDRRVQREPQRPGDAGDRAAQHEREEDARADGDAGEARSVRVGADRIEVSRRPEAAHRVGGDRDRDDRDPAEVRDPEHRGVPDPVEAVRQHRGVDLVPARPGAVDAADDVERPERHDEARNAPDGDDQAVHDAADGADRERDRERRRRARRPDGGRTARRSRTRRSRGPTRSRGRRSG